MVVLLTSVLTLIEATLKARAKVEEIEGIVIEYRRSIRVTRRRAAFPRWWREENPL